jgi:hypothetical protein
MEILLILAVSALNIVCFFVGAKVGQTASKGETIKTPTLNPLKLARERIDKKEAEMEQERFDTIMRNIESYDGTGRGQEDVPKG